MSDRTRSLTVALLLGCLCGLAVGVECSHVATDCHGWGAGQGTPPWDGWCCVPDYYTGYECGTGVKSVTLEELPPAGAGLECGRLQLVDMGVCDGMPTTVTCGGLRAYDGCTSKTCQQGS